MALQKQNINLNFSQGLDTKTDPWQVQAGKMLALENTIFNKGGLLQKRNGYQSLTTLPTNDSTTLTTYNGNLIAIGNELNVLSQDTMQWYNKGVIEPVELSVIPIVRTSSSQLTIDAAIAPNGLCCGVYKDSNGNSYYQIVDSQAGQIIVAYTQLPSTASLPRVFSLGNFFIITFLRTVSAATHFQYIAIPISSPQSPSSATDVSSQVRNLSAGYDGYVKNNSLYFAFDGSDGGNAIHIYFLDSTLVLHTPVVIAGARGDLISVTADSITSNNTVWISYYTAGITLTGKTTAYDTNLNLILAPTTFVTAISDGVDVNHLTSTSVNGTNHLFYESINSVITNFPADFIASKTVTTSGTVSSQTIVHLSVGLGSKSFYFPSNQTIYFLSAYAGPLQPTYFLMDSSGNIIAKLAYSNGAGYAATQILPSVHVSGTTIQIGYLFKSALSPVNKTQGLPSPAGIYAQTSGNLVTFILNEFPIICENIASTLQMASGFIWMYDGVKPVEHSFHVWPENVIITGSISTGGGLSPQQYFYQMTYEWTDAQGNLHRSAPSVPVEIDLTGLTGTALTFTAVFLTGTTFITPSSFTGLHVGQVLTDTTTSGNLAPGTYIKAIAGGTLHLSQATTGNSAASPGDTLQTVDTFEVDFNLPTLTLTAKTGNNPVRLVLYRWSANQQIYYQTTSISIPINNITTQDQISYDDLNNDLEILGNVIIYTTGGVVENIAAPASSIESLYKARLMVLDAEDPNLIWYSKQVIEDVPVEFSDLFTFYVAPTLSAQGSTGPITALSALDDKFIIFKEDAIYYMTGNGPDNTGANNDFSDPIFITSVVGCANQESIVFIPQGLMFQSDKGIWLLGRDLSTNYLGAPVEKYNQGLVQSAVNVPETNQVRFTLNTGITLMYDYYYNQWGTFINVPAVSSTIYQGLHTFINEFGQVFQESPGIYLDGSSPVLMQFTTAWFNLAGLQGYERAYFFYLLGNYLTPHKLQIQIAYDYNPFFIQSSMILPKNFNVTYGGNSLYGGGSPYGGNSPVEQWRIFLQVQKCESFQLNISEIYDPSFGVQAGAGLTLSGLDLVVGMKDGHPRLNPSLSVG